MLRLASVGPHEWRFVYPALYEELMARFHDGCEMFECGDDLAAEAVFRWVQSRMPDHLDAIHHLALVLSERAELEHASDLWRLSVVVGHAAFPPEFEWGVDRLEWAILDNRPFLRCLHGHALDVYERKHVEQALGLFRELLSLNPNDNQGARAMALECLFHLKRWQDAFDLTMRYPDDILCETLYGRALALFMLDDRRLAKMALTGAAESRPLVKAELLKEKHRRPKPSSPLGVALGSAEEAYEYWQRYGRFWKKAPGALEWLRSAVEEAETPE